MAEEGEDGWGGAPPQIDKVTSLLEQEVDAEVDIFMEDPRVMDFYEEEDEDVFPSPEEGPEERKLGLGPSAPQDVYEFREEEPDLNCIQIQKQSNAETLTVPLMQDSADTSTKVPSGERLKCRRCMWQGEGAEELEKHMRDLHPVEGAANQASAAKVLEARFNVKSIFSCSSCSFRHGDRAEVMDHIQEAHQGGQHRCQFCTCRYETLTALNNHIHMMHSVPASIPNGGVMGQDQSPSNVAKYIIVSKGSVGIGPNGSEEKVKLIPKAGGEVYECLRLIRERKQFLKCKKCIYETRIAPAMVKHCQNAHAKDGVYSCKECPCTFPTSQHLAAHCRTQHPKEPSPKKKQGPFKKFPPAVPPPPKDSNSTATAATATATTATLSIPMNSNANRFPSAAGVIVPFNHHPNVAARIPNRQKMSMIAEWASKSPVKHVRDAVSEQYKVEIKPGFGCVFVCLKCSFKCKPLAEIKEHCKVCYSKMYKCPAPDCPIEVNAEKTLALHIACRHPAWGTSGTVENGIHLIRVANTDVYRCPICFHTDLAIDKMRKHVQTHANNNGQTPCDVCGIPFTPLALVQHKNQVHRGTGTQNGKIATTSKSKPANQESVLNVATKHIVLPAAPVQSSSTTSSSNIESGTGKDPQEKKKSSKNGSEQKSHRKLEPFRACGNVMICKIFNEDGKFFGCGSCPYMSLKAGNVEVHIKGCHNPNHPYVCSFSQCQRRYKTTSRLAAHVKNMHSSEYRPETLANDVKDEVKMPVLHPEKQSQSGGTASTLNVSSVTSATATVPARRGRGRPPKNRALATLAKDASTIGRPDEPGKKMPAIPIPQQGQSTFIPQRCSVPGCDFQSSSNINTLDLHMTMAHSHNPAGQFRCDLCPSRFHRKEELIHHCQSFHKITRKAKEPVSKKNSVSQPNINEVGEPREDFKCNFCFYVTTRKNILHNHLVNAHGLRNQFVCNICEVFRFRTEGALQFHKYKEHRNQTGKKLAAGRGRRGRKKKPVIIRPSRPRNRLRRTRTHTSTSSVVKPVPSYKYKGKYLRCKKCHSSFKPFLPDPQTIRLCRRCIPEEVSKLNKVGSKSSNSANVDPNTPAPILSAKAARKYAEVETTADLPSDSNENETENSVKDEASDESKKVLEDKSTDRPPVTESKWKHCRYCNCKYPTTNSLERHEELCLNVTGLFKCRLCPRSFNKEAGLKRHITVTHGRRESNDSALRSSDHYSSDTEMDQTEVSSSPPHLSPIRDTDEEAEFRPVPAPPNPPKLYRCRKCEYVCRVGTFLQRHMESHHEGDIHCPFCPCHFSQMCNLSMHLSSKHASNCATEDIQLPLVKMEDKDTEVLRCDTCPFTTIMSHMMEVHLRVGHKEASTISSPEAPDLSLVKHEQQPTFACEKCSFTTHLRVKLRHHEKIHSEENIDSGEGDVSQVPSTPTRRSSSLAGETSSEKETDADSVDGPKEGIKSPSPSLREAESDPVNHIMENIMTKLTEGDNSDANMEVDEVQDEPPTKRRKPNDDAQKENIETQPEQETDTHDPQISDGIQTYKRGRGLREFMRFCCLHCARAFDTGLELVGHYKNCDNMTGLFFCNLCAVEEANDVRFKTLKELKLHVWKGHVPPEDQRKVIRERQENTAATSRENPYKCMFCKLAFPDKKSFIFHLSSPHVFTCRDKDCNFSANTKKEVRDHRDSVHHGIVLLGEVASDTSKNQAEAEPETDQSLVCAKCGHFSATVDEATEHIRIDCTN